MVLLSSFDVYIHGSIPALIECIPIVLFDGSKTKVMRVTASRVIALVHDDFAMWDFTVMQFKTHSVSQELLIADLKSPVPLLIAATRPFPTFIWSFAIDFRPKLLLDFRSVAQIHSFVLNIFLKLEPSLDWLREFLGSFPASRPDQFKGSIGGRLKPLWGLGTNDF
jgi:hypothetical protein